MDESRPGYPTRLPLIIDRPELAHPVRRVVGVVLTQEPESDPVPSLFGYTGLGWRFTAAVFGVVLAVLVMRIVRRIRKLRIAIGDRSGA